MEAMLRELNPDQQNLSGAAAGASTSGVNAGADPTLDKLFRSAWEESLIKSMDEELGEISGSGEADAAGGPEDAFQKSLRDALERLHRSDTEQQVANGSCARETLSH